MTLEYALTLALGLVSFFGGIWVKRIQDDGNKRDAEIERIKRDYQLRIDSNRDYATLKEFLQDMKSSMVRIEHKIDQKADKK